MATPRDDAASLYLRPLNEPNEPAKQGSLSNNPMRMTAIGDLYAEENSFNLIRERAEQVKVRSSVEISLDPADDPFCLCSEQRTADFIVTLNPKDFPEDRLKAKVPIASSVGGYLRLIQDWLAVLDVPRFGCDGNFYMSSLFETHVITVFIGQGVVNPEVSIVAVGFLDSNLCFLPLARSWKRDDFFDDCGHSDTGLYSNSRRV